MPFERFTQVGGSFLPMVSIRKNGQVGFSQGSLKRFGLDEGEHSIVLFYDRDAKVIGMKPTTDPREQGAMKLVKRTATTPSGKTSISSYISARSFLNFYNIAYREKIRHYEPVWSDDHKMILVDLTKERKETDTKD